MLLALVVVGIDGVRLCVCVCGLAEAVGPCVGVGDADGGVAVVWGTTAGVDDLRGTERKQ